MWNAFYGKRDAARQEAETSLKAFDGRDVAYAAGFALGLAGDAARVETLAAKLNQDHREDTQVQATYVPTLQALAALAAHDPQRRFEDDVIAMTAAAGNCRHGGVTVASRAAVRRSDRAP